MPFLIYGATGFTGDLIAREAARQGKPAILGGRREAPLRALGEELSLPVRVASLDDAPALARALEGVTLVLHCAGPFARTSRPMADACLARGVHYLDITGEIEVFEALAARSVEAQGKGVMLLPGVGFDVVPSDCLAAHLHRRLPSATHLALGLLSTGGVSHGTATTVVQNLGRGGVVRRGGKLHPVPTAWRKRAIDYGRGPVSSVTIPWGDVATAFHSTGIPDIEVYLAAPGTRGRVLRMARWAEPLMRTGFVKGYLQRWIDRAPAGPDAAQRAKARSIVWGEVTDPQGGRAVSRLTTPDGYDLTVTASLACVDAVMSGLARPGFQTPSLAFGPDLPLTLPGVTREDL
jgi:short subunit dehydrogenase-like uncharacterized protein